MEGTGINSVDQWRLLMMLFRLWAVLCVFIPVLPFRLVLDFLDLPLILLRDSSLAIPFFLSTLFLKNETCPSIILSLLYAEACLLSATSSFSFMELSSAVYSPASFLQQLDSSSFLSSTSLSCCLYCLTSFSFTSNCRSLASMMGMMLSLTLRIQVFWSATTPNATLMDLIFCSSCYLSVAGWSTIALNCPYLLQVYLMLRMHSSKSAMYAKFSNILYYRIRHPLTVEEYMHGQQKTRIGLLLPLQTCSLFATPPSKDTLVYNLKHDRLFRRTRLAPLEVGGAQAQSEASEGEWMSEMDCCEDGRSYEPRKLLHCDRDEVMENLLETSILSRNLSLVAGDVRDEKKGMESCKLSKSVHKQQCFVSKMSPLKQTSPQLKRQAYRTYQTLWPAVKRQDLNETLTKLNETHLSSFRIRNFELSGLGENKKSPKLSNKNARCGVKQPELGPGEHVPNFLLYSLRF